MIDARDVDPRVGGSVAAGFGPVVAAFAAGVLEPDRSGAALSIWRDGEPLVDIWTGVADERDGRTWEARTRSAVFSASKGLAALVVGILLDEGLVALDDPVAGIWPEFGRQGKQEITIGDALAHRAGLSAPADDMTAEDLRDGPAWARALADQRPAWEPGSGHAYHAVTYGPIVDEIVRRVSGREVRELFRERIALPLGVDIDFGTSSGSAPAWLVTSDDWARAVPSDPAVRRALTLGGAFPPTLVAGSAGFNDPRIQSLGLTAAGAIGTATALATIWSAAVTPTRGHRLLSDSAVDALANPRSGGRWVYDVPGPYQRWGAGLELSSDAAPMLGPTSIGHGGAGGQAAFVDRATATAIGYVRNRLDLIDPIPGIVTALREAAT